MEIIHYKTFQVRKWFYSCLVLFYILYSTKGIVSLQSLITQLAFKSYFGNNCAFSKEDQDKGIMQVNQCHSSTIYFLLLKRKVITPLLPKTTTTHKSQNYIWFGTNWVPVLFNLILVAI